MIKDTFIIRRNRAVMGRKSVRENKNIYQTSRENMDFTREEAGALMPYVSADRIEKIESGKSLPHPDEILAMSECYRTPELCNYYCSHECPIGQIYVPEVRLKDLSQITLEVIASLNTLEKEKNRLIEITVDGKISEDELSDFRAIQKKLAQISDSVSSLQLWVNKAIIEGKIPEKE